MTAYVWETFKPSFNKSHMPHLFLLLNTLLPYTNFQSAYFFAFDSDTNIFYTIHNLDCFIYIYYYFSFNTAECLNNKRMPVLCFKNKMMNINNNTY